MTSLGSKIIGISALPMARPPHHGIETLSQTGIMVSWYWHCATVPTVLPLVFLFLACFSRALVVDVLPERHFFRGVRHRVRVILDVLDDVVFVLVIFVFVFKPLLIKPMPIPFEIP